MDSSSRAAASVIMWISYLAMVWFSIPALGGWAILMAFVLMMPLMGGMGMMWSMGSKSEKSEKKALTMEANEQEKRKRERIDAVLRDLSSDELMRLKKRLVDGSIDDDFLYEQIVGDDGEFVDGY
jgi:hypothetical protein